MTKKIDKVEVYALILLAIIGVVWMLSIAPYLISASWFQNSNPVIEYLIYNLGFLFIFTAIFGAPIAYFFKKDRIHLENIIISGIATFLIFSFVIDMWMPPLYWSMNGNALINAPQALSGVAVDRVAGYIWTSIFPSVANTSLLFGLVYVITPIIAGILAALLLAPKQFVKLITKS